MTNNSEIIFGEWSFRKWNLILDDSFLSWDLIENLLILIKNYIVLLLKISKNVKD